MSASRLALDLGLIIALWKRDMLHLIRERSRWLGVVLQPLLFWAILGSGMTSVFQLKDGGQNYLEYFFPGILAMVVLFTAVFATMSVIEDRQHGFLQQVLVMPASRSALVLGKAAGVTTMALIQVLLCMPAAHFAGISLLEVHWGALLSVMILGCVGLTSMNFAMAWVIRSTGGYHAILSVLLLPLWMLSGAMFPAHGGWTGVVMKLNPMAYLVDGMRHALYGGHAPISQMGAGIGWFSDLMVLAAIALIFTAFAVWLVGHRIQAGRV